MTSGGQCRSNCFLIISISSLHLADTLRNMVVMSLCSRPRTSVYESVICISRSNPVNSHKCRCVWLFSALKTGPTSKTLCMPPAIDICLYNCGDYARHAPLPKYCSVKALAPPSETPGMILGLVIWIKPLLARKLPNSICIAILTFRIACVDGTLRWMTLALNSVSLDIFTY